MVPLSHQCWELAEVAVGKRVRGLGREGLALLFQFWVLQGESFGKPKRKRRK